MARSVKVPKALRRFLYGVFLLSWISGLTFFVLNRWVVVEGDFGPEKHPAQFWFLKAHGAAAFLMMIHFGYLLASHSVPSWAVKRSRPLGGLLVGAVGFLIVSAYFLYYIGDETWRTWVAYAHASVGVSLPFILAGHIWHARRQRRRAGRKRRMKGEVPTPGSFQAHSGLRPLSLKNEVSQFGD